MNTIGMATAVWPTVVPSASAGTTSRAGTSWTRTTEATMTSSQLPASAAAATLSRPMTNMTRVRIAITAAPAMPGANRTKAQISCET